MFGISSCVFWPCGSEQIAFFEKYVFITVPSFAAKIGDHCPDESEDTARISHGHVIRLVGFPHLKSQN